MFGRALGLLRLKMSEAEGMHGASLGASESSGLGCIEGLGNCVWDGHKSRPTSYQMVSALIVFDCQNLVVQVFLLHVPLVCLQSQWFLVGVWCTLMHRDIVKNHSSTSRLISRT